ncbi:MAG: TrkH family potassium uptake protein [Gammaproteobacteria bacterium]
MNLAVVQYILGLLIMLFSITLLPPIGVSLFYDDGSWPAFTYAFVVTLLAGAVIWFPVHTAEKHLRLRDGFLVVASFWIVLGFFGAVPFLMSEAPVMSFTDAVFESVSGLTTTGATVLTGLDQLPKSILYYRQQLQWLGGMGIIVLAVAVLPVLGVGGMSLYRAETPGPAKETKLRPRITQTAFTLWKIYFFMTVACGAAYWAAGMDAFDAISHSFSTVAIGGFSTHDASFGFFEATSENFAAIEMIAVFFMFAAGANFSLHFLVWDRQLFTPKISHYLKDPEFRAYVTVLATVIVITTLYLHAAGEYESWRESIKKGLFQAVSISTTTGFTTANYAAWPGALPVMLLFASFIGGCAGSTGGGMKVIRWLLIFKQGLREVRRLIHPSAEIPIRLSTKAVPPRVVDAVWGFFSVYIVLFGSMMLLLLATGLDQVTAFSAIAACLNNLGPGLGDVAGNFASITDLDKWVCIFAMWLGRLEIFTLFVLFTPAFWQR